MKHLPLNIRTARATFVATPTATLMATFLATIMATLIACPLLAQTPQVAQSPQDTTQMQRTVVVEQEYTPTISTARRVSALPTVTPPEQTRTEVEYVQTAIPATAIPSDTMQAITPQPQADVPAAPGYARLGAGLGGRIDGKAHYRFTLSPQDRLSLGLDFDGRQGDVALGSEAYSTGSSGATSTGNADATTAGIATGDWQSRYYQTRLAIGYIHETPHTVLDLGGHLGLSNLNYRPDAVDGRQKFTSGGLHLGWDATRSLLPLAVKAETNALFYKRRADLIGSDLSETLIRTRIEATGDIDLHRKVGVALAMDNAFYSVGTVTTSATDLESHTDIFLNPYYLYTAGDDNALSLRLGAHVDLALGYGTVLRVAPDVTLNYHFARYATLALQATGGKRMNDFRQLEAISPYGQILTTPEATYEPINASIGLQIGPMDGLYLHVFGGYQALRDDLIEGDYSALTASSTTTSYANYFYSQHTRNTYAGIKLDYNYRDLFTLSASATYRSWSSDWDGIVSSTGGSTDSSNDSSTGSSTDDPALAYKPQLDAQVEVGLRPVSALHIGLGYHHQSRPKVDGVKVDDISNLYLHATYDLLQWASIYVRADNLLDQDYAYYRAYTAPGITLLGGLAFRF